MVDRHLRSTKLYAWCDECKQYRRADIGDDPVTKGRLTEILRKHRAKWWRFKTCAGSGRDADPMYA